MSVSFPVSPKKQEALLARMLTLDIRESDLEESFVRSGGNGGQNVNKVSTAVRILHKPSGEEIKCNVYRTQGLNRYKARAILCERLESKSQGNIESPSAKRVLKIRKSKEDKARRAKKKKEKLLKENLTDLAEPLDEEDSI